MTTVAKSAVMDANDPADKVWVFLFNELDKVDKIYDISGTEGWDRARSLLGGKGANLARMTSLDVPVPAGFTVKSLPCTPWKNRQAKSLVTRPTRCWFHAAQALSSPCPA